jgi:MAE_28990/MAE_18760-like HEPN
MSVRTAKQLSDKLSNDLAWRKKELSEVKSLVEGRNVSPQRHDALIRSGVVILYAHWEGFIKSASNYYLEFVAMQKLRYDQLSSNFIALAMKVKLNEAKDTNKASLYIPVCDLFLLNLDQKCSLPYKDVISTTSNLSSEILKEITHILGVEFSPYSTKSTLIDSKLLRARNNIAHGKYLSIDREEYLELHTEVIGMLNLFRNQIENAAVNKSFVRTSL